MSFCEKFWLEGENFDVSPNCPPVCRNCYILLKANIMPILLLPQAVSELTAVRGIGRRSGRSVRVGGGGGDLVSTMPVCVCPKVKDMGPFSASSE